MSNTNTLTDYYQQQHRALITYAVKRLQGDMMTAEDMVQDTFLKLLTSEQLITPITLPALVHISLLHRITDYFRHRRRLQQFKTQYAVSASEESCEIFTKCVACQLTTLLTHRIDRMNSSTALVMHLSVIEEQSVSDIAKQLSMNYKTAEYHLHQGRKILRPYTKQIMGI